ncbi:hypothetical protein RIF29_08355 [Crotalaria pallida]|uniref:Rapid ALkalinization Factor n=1 Tax=Crotalaria pallida TaxID=3830 RepID=A0AAN9FT99_CROPI
MSQPRFTLMTFLYVLLHTLFIICNGLSYMDLNLLKHSEVNNVMTRRICTKSIGECLSFAEPMEMEMMDSESNRRMLAMQRRYISYETLKRDMVPCDRAGASYYNCHARQANPYNRGCEVITGCRGVQDIKT